MRRRVCLVALVACGACGRTELTVEPPPPIADATVRDARAPDAARDASSVETGPDASDVVVPDDTLRADVSAADRVDVATDAGVDADQPDVTYTWEAGSPVQSTAVSSAARISAVTTTSTVLVGTRTMDGGDRVVAFDFDGTQSGPAQSVLEVDGDGDFSAAPWVAWNGDHAAVAGSFVDSGCVVQSLDARGTVLGEPVANGAAECERFRARPDGSWDALLGGFGGWRRYDRVRFDAAYAPVGALDPMPFLCSGACNRASLADGTEVFASMDTATPGAHPAVTFLAMPTAPGASGPATVVAPGWTGVWDPHVVGVGMDAWIAWAPVSTPAGHVTATGTIAIVDATGRAAAPPIEFTTEADDVPRACALTRIRRDVLLVWASTNGSGPSVLGAQSFRTDGTPSSAPVAIARYGRIQQPEVVETPLGAMIVFAATATSSDAWSVYAIPVYVTPTP